MSPAQASFGAGIKDGETLRLQGQTGQWSDS
jgi:hypothetical protein